MLCLLAASCKFKCKFSCFNGYVYLELWISVVNVISNPARQIKSMFTVVKLNCFKNNPFLVKFLDKVTNFG